MVAQGTGRGSKTIEALANWDREMTYLNSERQKYETYVKAMTEDAPIPLGSSAGPPRRGNNAAAAHADRTRAAPSVARVHAADLYQHAGHHQRRRK